MDGGDQRLGVCEYNGGLFARDPLADTLILPDHLAQDVAKLGLWDYQQEVPVTVLGHLFEQSITDIEKLKAESRGEAVPAISKRKREGVVYTPDMITRFLVEKTIALTLDERRAALWSKHGMREATADEPGPEPAQEAAFWQDYLAALRDFTVIDPACGSGAFLVAAFDELARRYRPAVNRLGDLGIEAEFDIFDEIVTKNLYGVDLNSELVEITRLALWLKTARREHRLQNLENTIKTGNSLIEDPAFTDSPLEWRATFPEVFARGGFDVVIGNPPYVRMEYLKAFKPYLEKNYTVAADRADLYAYFFEKGVRLLKDGGRLGFISSSTFFRTGSGENLRTFLTDGVGVESVVDFGDLQIFEGVTTYPAILTVKKGEASGAGTLAFLNVKERMPEDLANAFTRGAQPMPRARLGSGSWRFEDDALARLRDKIVTGRKTLGEVCGAPLYGIKTGFNEAFVIKRATRDRLVAEDAKSAELLKPFLRGENIKRWRVESEDLWLINTPKGKVDIEQYPAVKGWLLPFRPELEKRATNQHWWELQQAQLAYQPRFACPKIVYPDIADHSRFSIDTEFIFIDCTVFMLDTNVEALTPYLNSRLAWFFWKSLTPEIRGGFIRFKAQYVSLLPLFPFGGDLLAIVELGRKCFESAARRRQIQAEAQHRILDLAPPELKKLTGKLENFHELDFAGFREQVKKAFHADIPVKERGDWEVYIAEKGAEVRRLTSEIETAEREIDAIVYKLFDLAPEEIALLEASLAGQY